MAYILILAAVFSAGAGSGYWMAYENSQAKIIRLEAGIDKANEQAKHDLEKSTEAVKKAEADAVNANANLDRAHVQDIDTINAWHDKHTTAAALAERLRESADHQGCPDAVPASADTGQHQNDAADTGDFSARLGEFFDEKTLQADRCAVDKNLLLKFVVEQSCGIKQDAK